MKSKLFMSIAILAILVSFIPVKVSASDATKIDNSSGFLASSTESSGEMESSEASSQISAKTLEGEETEDDAVNDASSQNSSEDEGGVSTSLSSVKDARNGVLQVNCVYTDDLGKKYIVYGGAGFLIGSPDGSEYVITNNHIVNPSKEYRDAAFKAIGVSEKEEWDKITLSAQVVVEGDVVLEASVVKSSESMDLVVLELEQPIYTRTPLTILTADDKSSDKPYEVPDSVYTLGYPTGITFEYPVYYSSEKVSMTSGAIANTTLVEGKTLIQHDAKIDESNCGGPLVNENGFVIGMNLLLTDGSNFYSLDSSEITAILDGLGIEYSKITTTEYQQLLAPEPEPEEEPVLVPAQSEVTKQDINVGKFVLFTSVLVAGSVLSVVIIYFAKKGAAKYKDKKQKEVQEEEALKINRFEAAKENVQSEGGANTSCLSVENATTVLDSGRSMPMAVGSTTSESEFLGTLVRKRTGENIVIFKDGFTIGKDDQNIDFKITDNSAISRKHATIKKINGEVVIEDNTSTNGTYINGIRLAQNQIKGMKNGDVIMLANEEFAFKK